MSNYILLIAWSVAGCSLAAVLLIYWRYRRMVRHYNNYIMKYIREHDLLAKELEYAKYKDPETRMEELRREAIIHANHYADTDTVKRSVGGTQLHKIGITIRTIEHQIYLALTELKKHFSFLFPSPNFFIKISQEGSNYHFD